MDDNPLLPPVVDPPLGECPPWCQLQPGHGWEDEWLSGPIRYHTWRRSVNKWHHIGLDEIEQWTPGGRVRERQLVLDVESPTDWDLNSARQGLAIIREAFELMAEETPDGKVG